MRDAAFFAAMLALLPLAVARPFVGVLLWSWISFMSPHRLLWGPALAVPWAAAVFGLTILGCVLAGEPRRPEQSPTRRNHPIGFLALESMFSRARDRSDRTDRALALNAVTTLLLALAVCVTVTSAAALGPPAAVWAKWEQTIKTLLGLLLTAALLTDRRRLHALVWIMVISLGWWGVRGGVFTLATAGNYRVWGPPESVIHDNNHLAAALLVTLPLINYLRLQSRHAATRWGLAAAMALTLMAMLGSHSRGALLGLAAASAVLWLRSRRKLATGLVLGACVAGAIAFMPERWTERMNTISTYEADSSATDRLWLWDISWRLALDRPLVGAGFTGPYTREVVDRVAPDGPARAVHSIWFEMLGEHGFPTFLVWIGLTVAGLAYTMRLTRLARHRPDLAWAGDLGRMAQVSIAAYLVSGSFLSLSYWDFYWTLLVVVAAAHALALRAAQGAGAPAAGGVPGWRRRAAPEPPPPIGAAAWSATP